jgi:transposase-like protein
VDLGYNPSDTWRAKPMAKSRRNFTAQFKFKVALEAVKEAKTLSELASEHGVHPNQITRWKQQLIKDGAEIFSHNADREKQKGQAVETDLFEQIGRLKMELEWLKKKVPL